MKTIFIYISLLLLASSNALASDLASKVKSMSKEEYLDTIPKNMNEAVIQNGGRIETGAGTFMIGVQRIGDMMVIMHELNYPQVLNTIQVASLMTKEEAIKYLKSNKFKDEMFGKDGMERKYMVNYACTQPIIRESLNKGIITKYTYLFSTGEYIGDIKITSSMCH